MDFDGELSFTIKRGQNLKDKELLGKKQDPYVTVQCGDRKFQTKVHNNGGRHPVWDETFTFGLSNELSILLAIYAKDNIFHKDGLMGKATVFLRNVRVNGSEELEVPVYSKAGKPRGHIIVSLEYTKGPCRNTAALPCLGLPPKPAGKPSSALLPRSNSAGHLDAAGCTVQQPAKLLQPQVPLRTLTRRHQSTDDLAQHSSTWLQPVQEGHVPDAAALPSRLFDKPSDADVAFHAFLHKTISGA